MEESTEGAAITSYAKDAAEDSVGPARDQTGTARSSHRGPSAEKLLQSTAFSTRIKVAACAVRIRKFAPMYRARKHDGRGRDSDCNTAAQERRRLPHDK